MCLHANKTGREMIIDLTVASIREMEIAEHYIHLAEFKIQNTIPFPVHFIKYKRKQSKE